MAKELSRLALRRGVNVPPEQMDVYIDDLMRFQADDIEEALLAIGREEPKAFESKWPMSIVLVKECERQEAFRRGQTSKIKDCPSKECIQGMVRVYDANGWCTGVVACPACGGPSWMADSLEHNRRLLRDNGLDGWR